MNNVEMWAKDKPPLIAQFAPQMAAFSRELPDLFRNLKKRNLANQKSDLPHLPSWYALYRNHKKYCEPFLKMLVESSEYASQLLTLGVDLHEHSRQKEVIATRTQTDDDLRNGRVFWHNLKELSFADLRDDFEDRKLDCATTATIQKYISEYSMEISFIFQVFTPCYILYKMHPIHLYRKACRNDSKGNVNISAIDMLLRLDPLMLHDPAIGQQIQKVRLFGRQTTYQNLVEAPLKPFKATITNSKIKASIASLISILAEQLNQPLTSREIRKLFDAIAKDADKVDDDKHIPRTTETFSKSIQRKRSSWEPLLPRTVKP
ncbi:MAG: hypothetical protein GJV46_10690 [Geobacter sp.]|nr:hypothetical protein [Geobacter sp.]